MIKYELSNSIYSFIYEEMNQIYDIPHLKFLLSKLHKNKNKDKDNQQMNYNYHPLEILINFHIKNIEKQESIVVKQILSINSILSHITFRKIRNYLKLCNGNEVNVINMLLENIELVTNDQKEIIDKRDELSKVEKEYMKLKEEYEKKTMILIDGNGEKDKKDDEKKIFSKNLKYRREKMLIEKTMNEEKKSKNVKFFCKGEEKLLEKSQFKIYNLKKSNVFHCTGEEIHFRIPESQFCRLSGMYNRYNYNGNQGKFITEVEYIVNPKIIKNFYETRKKLAKKHGWLESSMKPVLLFHGTSKENMDNIVRTNFLRDKIGSTTDMGYYGKGFYFSENSSLSMGYSRGNNQLLVVLVLIGKAFKVMKVNTGRGIEEGYDSHISGCGSEVVIFNPDQLLPCYRITYST